MKINLAPYLDQETRLVQQIFLAKGWDLVDDMWAVKKFQDREIYLVLYPKLLRYEYVYRPGAYGVYGDGEKKEKKVHEEHLIPWIACRFEIEHDEPHSKIAKEIRDWLKENFPLKPFYDEDASWGIYSDEERKGYQRYTFYVNPDFPDGWWQNHVL